MNRLTLATVRSTSLPGSVGLCAADISSVAAIVNEAQERLLHDPMAPDEGWWGGWARMVFNVTVSNRTAYITTPHNIARVIVMDVCQKPVKIRNGFYEFLQFGQGLHPKPTGCLTGTEISCACSSPNQAFERDSVVTLTEQTVSPATIRFYPSDASDVGTRVLLQGLDQNGKQVYGVNIDTKKAIFGEYVALNLPFVDSVNQYTSITGFQKAATLGDVLIFQVDPVTGDQTQISSMAVNEMTASYRRYLIDGMPIHCCGFGCGSVQITAQVKFDFVPVVSDPDYLIIQSLPAIQEEVQAIRYSRMDSPKAPELEAKHHMRALSLLFGQLDHFLGKTNTAISVPIFGSDRVRMQPR